MFYLGIDVANKSHKVLVVSESGEKLFPAFSLENSIDGFKSLLAKLTEFSVSKESFTLRA